MKTAHFQMQAKLVTVKVVSTGEVFRCSLEYFLSHQWQGVLRGDNMVRMRILELVEDVVYG